MAGEKTMENTVLVLSQSRDFVLCIKNAVEGKALVKATEIRFLGSSAALQSKEVRLIILDLDSLEEGLALNLYSTLKASGQNVLCVTALPLFCTANYALFEKNIAIKAKVKEVLGSMLCASERTKVAAVFTEEPKSRAFSEELYLASQNDECVLLLGECGSGKTRAASIIHGNSARAAKKGAFVHINMAECNENVIESFLFGTVRGAFTGAVDSEGAFFRANGGTLFFDEIAEIPTRIQAKLLTVIENGTYRKVGSLDEQKANARFIFATNADITSLISQKLFREDLFYRINTITIRVPALRDHIEDIPRLATSFATQKGKELSSPALKKLCNYSWPGNIRQLRNSILRACAFSKDSKIHAEDITF